MDKDTQRVLADSLGNPDRDFAKEPLSQEELQAVIFTYSEAMEREDLDPDLRILYAHCLRELKKHLIFH